MGRELFRREALEARRHGWLGGISLAQPVGVRVLVLGATLAAAAVVLFLFLGTYTRRSTVTGQLVPTGGLSTVLAPATGFVSRLDVAEGSQVRRGQTLAVVAVPRATVAEGDTQAALEQRLVRRREGLVEGWQAQRQLQDAQGAGLRVQLAVAQRELAQVEAEAGTRREQIRIAEETLQRLRQLQDQRYVSLLQIKQQESSALSWRGEMQALQRQAIAVRRTIAQLRQSLQELPGQARASDAGLERELAQLEQEQVETRARGALTVNAPVTGAVSAQLVKPGQAVQAGQPLLSLLPDGSGLEAELLVPSRAIGFIAPGDAVLLRYRAFPYQKFGHQRGRVARISRSALGPGEVGALTGDARTSEPYYRVTVSLARQAVTAFGREEPLRPGMVLDADILGERRRLIEWVFEPLYSLKGKVGGN
ncbi:MAG: HlyD family efflux transporter periplasmic adaptor subunit [Pseudoxanthomonas sp.]|nr:HlyD family efflux transporter periplasmic adaptor subunit [Pseudoxanthomonas sp.]